jgi:hypothetical protein
MYVIVRVVTPPRKAPRMKAHDAVKGNSTAKIQPASVEPDGAIVHCIAISDMVMKIGRITVPPAIAIACEGFSRPSPNPAAPYSATNPPPHWESVQNIWRSGGEDGAEAMREFLSGGWKRVPEKQRWWNDALGGPVEARRLANLRMVQGVRGGMEGFR